MPRYPGAMPSLLAPDTSFTPVDPRLARIKIISGALGWAVPFLPLIALCATLWRNHAWTWVFPGLVLVCAVWYLVLIPRRVRSWGYAELPNELLIRRGIMFQHLDVIPYGRMQQVTVESGPLLSRVGLASITLVTASATTNGEIPGIPSGEAERLRAKLAALGEANMEGL